MENKQKLHIEKERTRDEVLLLDTKSWDRNTTQEANKKGVIILEYHMTYLRTKEQ